MLSGRVVSIASRLARVAQPPSLLASLSSRAMSTAREAFPGAPQFDNVILEKAADGKVAVITLNRPRALNALSKGLMADLKEACAIADASDSVGAVVITGGEKIFAAGADIKEMKDNNMVDNLANNFLSNWTFLKDVKKPTIAAVNGYALGGGCEVAMMCDIMYASETAKFGQPEIKLGVIPGAGGTQRLTRAVGKAKAMEMNLTGRMMGAEEAKSYGLVAGVYPAGTVIDEAVKVGSEIAAMSKPIVAICKDAVNKTYEMTLSEGIDYERRMFHVCFGTEDQKEGMAAFAEKRQAEFKDR